MEKPLLDFSTILVRPTIVIDGQPYEMKHPDEFSLDEQQSWQRWAAEISGIFKDDADAENVSKGTHALARAIQIIMPTLPPELFAKLSDTQRMVILQAFTQFAATMGLLSIVPTGGDSSHGSSDSTAGVLPTGSSSQGS